MRHIWLARDAGLTRAELRTGERRGLWRKIEDGAYGDGGGKPTPIDRAVAALLITGGAASGAFAGYLYELDSVKFRQDITVRPGSSGRRPGIRRRAVKRVLRVKGLRCVDGLLTLLDLAAELDDLEWEQALESALRKHLTTVDAIKNAARGVRGVARIRRVLALRPSGAPPTESLLETLMVQLIRRAGLPEPTRQFIVYDSHGAFVARVDLCWPELGVFVELDGQHHEGQPVYDADRESAVVAATGWLCGRFTWRQVVRAGVPSARRLCAILEQARRRPLAR